MKHVGPISENEMVAAFLKGEISSSRFGPRILDLLELRRLNRSVIDSPDLRNEAQNTARRGLLGDFRGYGQNRGLFLGFPETILWSRQELDRRDLENIFYVDYSYWNELSEGTRQPCKVAAVIRAGKLVYGQGHGVFWNLADALKRGDPLPEMILVGRNHQSEWVVLEGHARLTAYFLVPDSLSEKLTAIVGVSPEFSSWMALPDRRAVCQRP